MGRKKEEEEEMGRKKEEEEKIKRDQYCFLIQ